MRDNVRESWFKKHEWKYQYEERFELDGVATRDAQAQIRLGQEVDAKHVGRLERAIQDRADLPAIIVADLEGSFHLADGIHRLAAFQKIGRKRVDAYVVAVGSPAELEFLRRTANSPLGKGLSAEEATIQAVALVDAGWTKSDAARAMGVLVGSVSREFRAREALRRIAACVPGVGGAALSTQTLDVLGQLRRDDVLRAATEIVAKARMPSAEARLLVRRGVEAVTDAEVKALLDSWDKEFGRSLAKLRVPAESNRVKNAPAARLHRATVRVKAAMATWDNLVGDVRLLKGEMRVDATKFLKDTSEAFARRASGLDRARGSSVRRRTRQRSR